MSDDPEPQSAHENERIAVLLRVPRYLLTRIDEYDERTAPAHRPGSRTATMLALLERGLNDIARIKRDKKRPR
jgi:hypothetical protein